MRLQLKLVCAMTVALGMCPLPNADEYQSGVVWPEPAVVASGSVSKAPADAVVLFDGTNLSKFEGSESWKVIDGYAEVGGNDLRSKQAFGDCQLHLEFATPEVVRGEGQGRGNSGVYLMGKYEVQILDSYENKTYFDGQCGSIYKQQPPMVNVSRRPGKWQSFDIIFTAPRFNDDDSLKSPAFVTLLHNGVLVHNHFELKGGTFWDQPAHYETHADKLPITIQNHGNPTRFRNIWVRENVQPLVGKQPESSSAGR